MSHSVSQPRRDLGMPQGLSLYLDVVRLGAAIEVFLYHLLASPAHKGSIIFHYGHEAVVVFFVLSGYVISYSAACRDRTLTRFVSSRIVRVHSVSVPVLCITLALQYVGYRLNPAPYAQFGGMQHSPVARFVITLFLANENWISVQAFSDPVFWSLCYEVMYYALFAGFFFFTGRQRVLLVLFFAILVGPKILLLAPVWIMGSWAFFESSSARWPRSLHWVLLLLIVPESWLYGTGSLANVTARLMSRFLGWPDLWWHLGPSREFLSDWYLGLIVTLHFIGAKNLAPVFERILAPIAPAVRNCASYTFTLYMLHVPVLLFVQAVFGPGRALTLAAAIPAVALATFLVGFVTEKQRYRLKRPVERLVSAALAGMLSGLPGFRPVLRTVSATPGLAERATPHA